MTPASAQTRLGAVAEAAKSELTVNGRTTRRRLLILGENELEVVRAAGGLTYDWSSGGGRSWCIWPSRVTTGR